MSETEMGFRIGLERADQTAMAGVRHHSDLPHARFLQRTVDLVRPRRLCRGRGLASRFCRHIRHRAIPCLFLTPDLRGG